MDDPHFDHKSAKRFDRQRASGPFGIDEILPKKISTWVNRKHPDTGKRQTLLNFVEWQRGQAARILQDFELHVYEWTLTSVKHRESLDKQDKTRCCPIGLRPRPRWSPYTPNGVRSESGVR